MMKTWPLSLAVAAASLLSTTAHADQCQWNDPAHGEKAQEILAKQPKVIAFCEPCGDKVPGEPAVATAVKLVTPAGSNYREVIINGTAVDLAYTYVQTSSTKYTNMAKLVGCPASGVSPFLKIKDETDTGVLITTTQDPPPRAPEAPAIVVAAPPPPPLPPTPQYTYHTTTIEQSVPWIVILVAAAGGFVSGAAFAMLAMAMRTRRRAMQPRATNLPVA